MKTNKSKSKTKTFFTTENILLGSMGLGALYFIGRFLFSKKVNTDPTIYPAQNTLAQSQFPVNPIPTNTPIVAQPAPKPAPATGQVIDPRTGDTAPGR